MYRNLFISIHEPDDDFRAGRSRKARPARGSDPGGDFMQSDPDDPGGDFMQSDPDDPGGDFMQSDPDDPGSGSYPAYGRRDVVGTVYAQSFAGFPGGCCCCGKGSEESAATAAPARDYSGFVIVRLAADVRPLHFASLYRLARELELKGLQAALEVESSAAEAEVESSRGPRRGRKGEDESRREPEGVLASAPLIDMPVLEPECDGEHELRTATVSVIHRLENQARTTAFRPLHSLASYWRVDLRPYPELVDEVLQGLRSLREVDVAYRELSAENPQAETALSGDQGYLDDAPVGIGARWAWGLLKKVPNSVRILDLEQGWVLEHETLARRIQEPLYGDNRATPEAPELGQHGTAVLGQVAASQMLEGAVQGATFLLASHYKGENDEDESYPFPRTNGHVAAAIFNALAASRDNPKPLERGDVLLLEVQRGRFPTEIDAADFDAIRLASALGVIVVEAAGNGNYDLDRIREPVDGRTFRRGDSRFQDSGAIFVGACLASLPHDRAPFSNFGSRVDCFAWGEGVTTAGYGDLMGDDVAAYYTNTFSGTSSAAPVIAGAAALVQGLHSAQAQTPLRPRPMRTLLSNPATGVRQGPDVGGHIGIMPDLRRVVGGELQVVPQLYLRKRPGDTGEPAGPEDEISSSPDILVWSGSLPGQATNAQGAFGSSSQYAYDPAPGGSLQAGKPGDVCVRVCNRGGGVGKADVRVFAAPAASLITPEHWQPLGDVRAEQVLQGDTLIVSSSLPWTAPSFTWPPAFGTPMVVYSLLAVLPEEGADPEWPVLPPGPPYFDWDAFRGFLRRRGVAWRNVHRVEVGTGDVVLACHLGGTPDRERRFDFEVIQRLPKGVEVTLAAPAGLAAKLHQRQPWLHKTADGIDLPRRRSTRFSQVTLPAHAFVPVSLKVHGGSLGSGHSLALRQLWEGEEVGRITWHFARAA